MDLDAYIDAHSEQWRELEQLVKRSRLSPDEVDRLVDLYERVGTHLSVIRSGSPDPQLVMGLSNLLARARRRAGAGRAFVWGDLLRFFTRSFPASLYLMRRWWILTGLAWIGLAFVLGGYLVAHPELMVRLGTPAELQRLVDHDFEDYYSSDPARSFALRLVLNNAWVAAQCIAYGVLGFPTLSVLLSNCYNVAFTGAVMVNHQRAGLFFGLILPHGLLELTGIFVAGGVGLRLFWSWVAPGARTRMSSMAHVGRQSLGVVLGLVVLFAVSAVLEAFITPSPLPSFARVAIGAVVWLAFLYYALVVGRAAAATGATGDLDAEDRGEELISVD
ncbi:stage II sporulation protein M [Aestuariimicrobium kwangyangense]|uniref:stage II sporulation protein M n=1 Tax=Aestuariimicrobium kwangyangense TaxID=396389 RepID=UPI0003B64FF3|nr:stage II sporulation protein M [Aestuariimicrobium kwangyangense]